MTKAVYIVVCNSADPAREDEFNHWYTDIHSPDILTVPGVVAGTRYQLASQSDPSVAKPDHGKYLAIWEIDAEDPADVVANIWKGAREWAAAGRGGPGLDLVYHAVYASMAERMLPEPASAQGTTAQ